MSSRDEILESIRQSLGRGALPRDRVEGLEARLENPRANLIPARSRVSRGELVAQFAERAENAAATVVEVASLNEVPAAIVDYLTGCNLPLAAARAPDPLLDGIAWDERSMLSLRRGNADPADEVTVTSAFAGVAETGTLMLLSGPEHPTALNFLPETHIVVLPKSRVVGAYEDGIARMRAALGAVPRTINFVTGPSRTGDIEQTIELGAHGPRRLHIVMVDDETQAG